MASPSPRVRLGSSLPHGAAVGAASPQLLLGRSASPQLVRLGSSWLGPPPRPLLPPAPARERGGMAWFGCFFGTSWYGILKEYSQNVNGFVQNGSIQLIQPNACTSQFPEPNGSGSLESLIQTVPSPPPLLLPHLPHPNPKEACHPWRRVAAGTSSSGWAPTGRHFRLRLPPPRRPR